MFGYRIEIYVHENGYPEWQHDLEKEEQLNPEQQETAKAIHDAYKGIQRAISMVKAAQDSSARLRALKERFPCPMPGCLYPLQVGAVFCEDHEQERKHRARQSAIAGVCKAPGCHLLAYGATLYCMVHEKEKAS